MPIVDNDVVEFNASPLGASSLAPSQSAHPLGITGKLKPGDFRADFIGFVMDAGSTAEDLGSATASHGVPSGQLLEIVLQLPVEHREMFLKGHREERSRRGQPGLSVTAGRLALTVEALGPTSSGQCLKRLLERTKTPGGVLDAGGGEDKKIARALERLSIPLTWFVDALYENGVGTIHALRYVRSLLPFWREDHHLTDLGNAHRLVSLYGPDIRYCPERGWLVWDGRRWRVDAVGVMEYRAKQIAATWRGDANLLCAIAADAGDTPEADAILERAGPMLKWAKTSESLTKIKAMVEMAKSEPGIPIRNAALDANPMVLNVKNGTVDLRGLRLRPHDRDDLITKLAPVNYRLGARFALWDSFLNQVTSNDSNYQQHLQRVSGYVATGDVGEEVFFFLYGPGGSGKSTFVKALETVLGDYAATADFDTFVKRPGGGTPRNDIARLDGKRAVFSIEVDEGRELAQGLVKTITGGDTVSARFLYKEFFEFSPTFKLLLVANDAPAVDPDDVAMWRRLRVLPMNNALPQEEQKPWMKQVLSDPDIAGPAILNWILEGCRQWQVEGLGVAVAVQKATEEYRESQDALGEFLEDYCTVGPDLEVESATLYSTYLRWALVEGLFAPLTKNAFGRKLTKKGLTKGKLDGKRSWVGITVKETAEVSLAWELVSNTVAALPGGRTLR